MKRYSSLEYYQTKKNRKKLKKKKMKNGEEKNQLLVELCYNHHFHNSDSLILDHHHCEIFQKYSINQKILKQSLSLIDWQCQMVFVLSFVNFYYYYGVN